MLAPVLDQGPKPDEYFMLAALMTAATAAARGEVPVGAVLVRNGEIIARAHNSTISMSDPTAHAEVLALRRAAQREGNYRLPGTVLVVTLEPCVMCVGALLQARVQRLVFGCRDPKAGALGSCYDIGRDGRGNHQLEVHGGVLDEAASRMLQTFFRARRGA